MRDLLTFACNGVSLSATLDGGAASSGLLIVSGGNEIRTGAHRGMARLAQQVAAKGHPVFRFDRRGIGDSEGVNGSFQSSADDIAAAITAFRAACPTLDRIVAFGNCDAATALILHGEGFDRLVLANPWIIEAVDDLPPPAAIRARYSRRLRDPAAWAALVSGKLNLGAAMRGIGRIARSSRVQRDLQSRVASALARPRQPASIILASGDNTAIAFDDAWKSAAFAGARAQSCITVTRIASSSHSFTSDADFAALLAAIDVALNP